MHAADMIDIDSTPTRLGSALLKSDSNLSLRTKSEARRGAILLSTVVEETDAKPETAAGRGTIDWTRWIHLRRFAQQPNEPRECDNWPKPSVWESIIPDQVDEKMKKWLQSRLGELLADKRASDRQENDFGSRDGTKLRSAPV